MDFLIFPLVRRLVGRHPLIIVPIALVGFALIGWAIQLNIQCNEIAHSAAHVTGIVTEIRDRASEHQNVTYTYVVDGHNFTGTDEIDLIDTVNVDAGVHVDVRYLPRFPGYSLTSVSVATDYEDYYIAGALFLLVAVICGTGLLLTSLGISIAPQSARLLIPVCGVLIAVGLALWGYHLDVLHSAIKNSPARTKGIVAGYTNNQATAILLSTASL